MITAVRPEVVELLMSLRHTDDDAPERLGVDDGDGLLRGLTVEEQSTVDESTLDEWQLVGKVLAARSERLQRLATMHNRLDDLLHAAGMSGGVVVEDAITWLDDDERVEAEVLLASLPKWMTKP